MRARGNSQLVGLALAACLLAIAPATALADDANTLPPDLELKPSGTNQSPVGLHGGSLASYSTADPDPSWAYPAGSKPSFSCLIDGLPAPCSNSYHRSQYTPGGGALGPYTGWVPIPEGLANGTHSVTVIASDEDGVDPDPPTVTTVYDTVAPAAPRIVSGPPRVSRNPKPKFRYSAVDERVLYDTNDPFSASLRRIKPPGPRIHTGDPFGSYLEWRGPFCPTEFTCTEVAWAAYSGSGEGGTSFGIRERLSPGLYEFRVSVSDTVSNESPATKYRFRVLQSRPRKTS